jgi:hypothetical protein
MRGVEVETTHPVVLIVIETISRAEIVIAAAIIAATMLLLFQYEITGTGGGGAYLLNCWTGEASFCLVRC